MSTIRQNICPVEICENIIGQKWTILIIRDLSDGSKHFSELEDSLTGISPRMLCKRLGFLTENDLVLKSREIGKPPRTCYELTSKGKKLIPLITEMRKTGIDLQND